MNQNKIKEIKKKTKSKPPKHSILLQSPNKIKAYKRYRQETSQKRLKHKISWFY
jgi:hypothetical protein